MIDIGMIIKELSYRRPNYKNWLESRKLVAYLLSQGTEVQDIIDMCLEYIDNRELIRDY